jgi:hypothetical protein
MVPYQYTEDIFLEFYHLMVRHGFALTGQDQSATYNFYSLISAGSQLTQSQAGLIIKILKKHKIIAQKYNFDYVDQIENPVWKNEFRILDLTKKIFVEKDESGELLILLKFPFSMKETFDREFSTEKDHFKHSRWNQEKKLREVKFSEINVVALYEFLRKHHFEIDDSFLEAVESVEEIWANQEDFLPHSTIFENQLVLINSNEYADAYFEKNSTGNIHHDMLLAKSMQFPLNVISKPQEIVEKIASSNNNIFWIDSNENCNHRNQEGGLGHKRHSRVQKAADGGSRVHYTVLKFSYRIGPDVSVLNWRKEVLSQLPRELSLEASNRQGSKKIEPN